MYSVADFCECLAIHARGADINEDVECPLWLLHRELRNITQLLIDGLSANPESIVYRLVFLITSNMARQPPS